MKLYILISTSLLTIGVASVVYGYISNQDWIATAGTVIVSASIAVIVLILEGISARLIKRKELKYLTGDDWTSYSYTEDTPHEGEYSNDLKNTPNRSISCQVRFGKDSDLEMIVTGKDKDGITFSWLGLITMTSSNTGEIAYYHTKDRGSANHGIDAVGYKKLIAFRYHNETTEEKTVRLYISQADRNIAIGREVFVRSVC